MCIISAVQEAAECIRARKRRKPFAQHLRALALTVVEWGAAVGAHIVDGNHLAAVVAEQHNLLAQHLHTDGLLTDILRQRCAAGTESM